MSISNRYPTKCVQCNTLCSKGGARSNRSLRGAILDWICVTCDSANAARAMDGDLPPDLGGRDFLRRRVDQNAARIRRAKRGR